MNRIFKRIALYVAIVYAAFVMMDMATTVLAASALTALNVGFREAHPWGYPNVLIALTLTMSFCIFISYLASRIPNESLNLFCNVLIATFLSFRIMSSYAAAAGNYALWLRIYSW